MKMEKLKRLEYHSKMLRKCIRRASLLFEQKQDRLDLIEELDKVNYHLMHAKRSLDELLFYLLVKDSS